MKTSVTLSCLPQELSTSKERRVTLKTLTLTTLTVADSDVIAIDQLSSNGCEQVGVEHDRNLRPREIQFNQQPADVCYIEQINRWRTAVKKRLLHGFGIALMLASPIWITIGNPPDYMNFGISLALGILLMILASKTSPDA